MSAARSPYKPDYAAMTPRQAMQVAAALGDDPSSVPVRCEAPGCTRVVALKDAYSMAVVYRMPGPGKAPYQCPSEQHFGCSHECARAALLACLSTHIEAGNHGPDTPAPEPVTAQEAI